MVPVDLDQTNWVYALNTPIWAYGISPCFPPYSTRQMLRIGQYYEIETEISGKNKDVTSFVLKIVNIASLT